MRRVTPNQIVRHYGTQRAAGKALGVTQQAVSNWVQRKRVPRQYQFLALLDMGEYARVKK
jgi:predicted transcriptional regulator